MFSPPVQACRLCILFSDPFVLLEFVLFPGKKLNDGAVRN